MKFHYFLEFHESTTIKFKDLEINCKEKKFFVAFSVFSDKNHLKNNICSILHQQQLCKRTCVQNFTGVADSSCFSYKLLFRHISY